jgi:hypothetical protein
MGGGSSSDHCHCLSTREDGCESPVWKAARCRGACEAASRVPHVLCFGKFALNLLPVRVRHETAVRPSLADARRERCARASGLVQRAQKTVLLESILLLAVADDKLLIRTARSNRDPWRRLFFAVSVLGKRLFGRGASRQRQVVHLDCLLEAVVLARLRPPNAEIEGVERWVHRRRRAGTDRSAHGSGCSASLNYE